jgi:hypothetical protein
MTKLRDRRSGSTPRSGNVFISFPKRLNWLGDPTSLLLSGILNPYGGDKAAGAVSWPLTSGLCPGRGSGTVSAPLYAFTACTRANLPLVLYASSITGKISAKYTEHWNLRHFQCNAFIVLDGMHFVKNIYTFSVSTVCLPPSRWHYTERCRWHLRFQTRTFPPAEKL